MSAEANRADGGLDRLCLNLATLFGVGWIPRAPGTAASLVTLPAACALDAMGPAWYALATLAILLIAMPVCGRAADLIGRTDPPEIVLDEVAGMLIAFSPFTMIVNDGRAVTVGMLILSFAFFRWFDIKKPGWIGKAQHLPGGTGIVMDDVIAGLAAAVTTGVIYLLFRFAIPTPVH